MFPDPYQLHRDFERLAEVLEEEQKHAMEAAMQLHIQSEFMRTDIENK